MKALSNTAFISVLSLVAIAPSAFAASDNLVLQWNSAVLQAIRDNSPGPTIASRALHVTSTCAYDAWAAYDEKALAAHTGKSLRQKAQHRTQANINKAVSFAYYQAAVDLFPQSKPKFDALMNALGYSPTESSNIQDSPVKVARVACDAVLKYRHQDGSNQKGDLAPGAYSDYTGYRPVNTPYEIVDGGRWQPLAVRNANGVIVEQKFLTPHWGKVKPFEIKSVRKYKIDAPPAVGSKEYKEQVDQVISYSANLTDQQKVIAEYWADGPHSELPPGHWNLFAQYVSRRDGHQLDDDVKMFFALNNALLNAGIWAWHTKREFDYVRPVTAVHYLYGDQVIQAWGGPGMGSVLMSGADWTPYQPSTVVTPPFAECVSGHSTFSSAAAAVLRGYTGSDVFGYSAVIPAGASTVEPGIVPQYPVTLSWPTFTDAADEAGLSRLYGGIHFRNGDLPARNIGSKLGADTLEYSMALFAGHKTNDK
ncbi:vanadium-dependent haloperoxidase [Cellvibrio fibrivorans]|uniref:Phosphoesterase n=1 Tax=Cellvibrio fibrivorans TaxID=126350 RepID=A0ABU1UTP6_9GAMM|nr:vanadium-dependent haloperoxidase [Cellvibrio fibrivorans]MDR7088559.1 hypothetical protein [Cellvibrio fibrivorans]